MVSAYVLTALQTVISRYSHPKVPSVLSFGKINSDGGATNIIPDRVFIQGTLRTMDEDNRLTMHKVIREMVQHTVKSFGAKSQSKDQLWISNPL